VILFLSLGSPRTEGHMPVTIGRREVIAALGGAAVAWPLAARAQQVGKLPTIGFLGSSTLSTMSEWIAAFVQRLRERGWIEGRNIAIEYRWAEARRCYGALVPGATLISRDYFPNWCQIGPFRFNRLRRFSQLTQPPRKPPGGLFI